MAPPATTCCGTDDGVEIGMDMCDGVGKEVGCCRPAVVVAAARMSCWIAVISGAPGEEVVGVVRDGFCDVLAAEDWDCA